MAELNRFMAAPMSASGLIGRHQVAVELGPLHRLKADVQFANTAPMRLPQMARRDDEDWAKRRIDGSDRPPNMKTSGARLPNAGELLELHAIVELGPSRNTIKQIVITVNRPSVEPRAEDRPVTGGA
jgi:hypothetical protein